MTEGTAVRVNGTLGAGAGNGGPGTPCEGRYNPDELKNGRTRTASRKGYYRIGDMLVPLKNS